MPVFVTTACPFDETKASVSRMKVNRNRLLITDISDPYMIFVMRCADCSWYYLVKVMRRSRLALLTTVSEDIAIAAPAIIGLSNSPKNGYSAPAATGMPSVL